MGPTTSRKSSRMMKSVLFVALLVALASPSSAIQEEDTSVPEELLLEDALEGASEGTTEVQESAHFWNKNYWKDMKKKRKKDAKAVTKHVDDMRKKAAAAEKHAKDAKKKAAQKHAEKFKKH